MDAIRRVEYTIDIDQYKKLTPKILKQLDSTLITLIIKQNGVAANLSGNSFILNFGKPDGTVVIQTNGINTSQATSGILTIELDEDCIRVPGEGYLELEILKDGKKITNYSLPVYIDKSLVDSMVPSQNKLTLIEELEAKIQEGLVTKEELDAWVAAHQDIVELENTVASHSTQLEEMTYSIKSFGAKIDGYLSDGIYIGTDDTVAIRATISKIKEVGSGTLFFPDGITMTTGNIELPSNITIKFAPNAQLKLLKTSTASIFVNDTINGNTNITFDNIKIDAQFTVNDTRTKGNNHAVYLKNVSKINIINCEVKNPIAFGWLIDTGSDISVLNYRSFSTEINADGFHLFDCSKVRINGIYGETGDDVLGITANNISISDYVVSNIQGKSYYGNLIRLNQADSSISSGKVVTISDIQFINLNGWDCGARGFSLTSIGVNSKVERVKIQGQFRNCGATGDSTVRLDKFNSSEIDVFITDVPSGKTGLYILKGDKSKIKARIDYINGTKTLQMCIKTEELNNSHITECNTKGGLRSFQIGVTGKSSSNNYITNNIIEGANITEGGNSDNNIIKNNKLINAGITKVGANTKVENNDGYKTEGDGTATIASGSTSITVNHGLVGAPRDIQITGLNAETVNCYVEETSITSTYFQIKVPTAVTANRNIKWSAKV